MTMSESSALLHIMKIIATPGEEMNDGEILDQIIFILEELGMPVQEEISAARKEYEKNNTPQGDE